MQTTVSQASQDNIPDEFRIVRDKGYTILNLLGQGSYAKVYQCDYRNPKDPNPNITPQSLACKVINGNLASKEFVEKFLPRELSIITKLNHKNIIRVHSIIYLMDFKKWFIFMQVGENGDLLKFITEYGPLREKRCQILFTQLLSALDYLHRQQMVHRDIKCENVLLTSAFNLKLSDFGFAKIVQRNPDTEDFIKSTTYCGSLQYAPPEIIRGQEYDPFKVDIWSSGVLLYVILNQALPFEQSTRKALYSLQMKKAWKWRRSVSDRISTNLKYFLPRLLQPHPDRRPSVQQLLEFTWIKEDLVPIMSPDVVPSAEITSVMTLKAVPSTTERFIPVADEVLNLAQTGPNAGPGVKFSERPPDTKVIQPPSNDDKTYF